MQKVNEEQNSGIQSSELLKTDELEVAQSWSRRWHYWRNPAYLSQHRLEEVEAHSSGTICRPIGRPNTSILYPRDLFVTELEALESALEWQAKIVEAAIEDLRHLERRRARAAALAKLS